MNVRRAVPAFLSLTLFFAGCHSKPTAPAQPTASAGANAVVQHRAEMDTDREQIAMIPPPSKARYMAVHSFEQWENPYITVQPDMLTLHVLLADSNTSGIGAGGIFRPVGARREEISINMSKLPEAMTAVPQTSWPYGRVVAIEEAHKTPPAVRPVVRRNMEAAIGALTDLGIVVYDISEGSVR